MGSPAPAAGARDRHDPGAQRRAALEARLGADAPSRGVAEVRGAPPQHVCVPDPAPPQHACVPDPAPQCLADSLEPVQLTPLVLPYTEHKNPKVRGQAARTLARSQSRLEVSRVWEGGAVGKGSRLAGGEV